MKANELMCGDWVLYKGKPIKIIGTDDSQNIIYYYNEEDYTEYPIYASNIESIPLTPEILEKNGFTSKEDQYNHKKYFLLGKNEYNYDVYLDRLTILLVEEEYEPATYAYTCDVNYVHELQHALKLYGIEKEIVL